MKTLIIHPQDRSTAFLKPIYQNIKNKRREFIDGCYYPRVYAGLQRTGVVPVPHFAFGSGMYGITLEGAKSGNKKTFF